MSGFIWYSFGSDKTGPQLGELCGFDAGKKTPKFANYDVVVGWGCKPGTKYDSEQLALLVAQNQVRILNHPDPVTDNRDKLATLQRLKALDISVPGLLEFDPKRPQVAGSTLIPHALESGRIAFPLVILTRYNRGEPIFCYTVEDVKTALKGNTKKEHPYSYARTYDHGDEYRVHVFRDTVLFAQKKQLDKDPVIATTLALEDKYVKRKDKVDEPVPAHLRGLVREVCGMLANEILSSAHQLKKSVKMGWKYMDTAMDAVPPEVAMLAIETLDAARLDLGAVSISHTDGTPRVLSITTAPALTDEQMGMYVAEIQAFAKTGGKAKETKVAKKAARTKQASPELVAKLYRKMKGLSEEKAAEVLKSLGD